MAKKEIKHIDFNSIENPNFLKELDYKELDVLAEDIRNYLLDNVSKNGGHLSSNLGVVEATIAMCRAFDFSKDKVVFDVGHQAYTYKILTGRSLERLRERDGVSGFQKMCESPYDHFEAGHSSTSISVINGMALARDLKKENYDVVAFIGDASIANGLAFEGLNSLAQGHHKAIIILNDNGMSIAKPSGGVAKAFRKFSTSNFYRRSKNLTKKIFLWNKLGSKIYGFLAGIKNWFKRHVIKINLFDTMGYKMIGPIDGNDIKKVENALLRAKKQDRSTIVYIKTIKGLGYKYAEEDKTGYWHGVTPFDLETGKPLAECESGSWSKQYCIEIEKQLEKRNNLVVISPATQLGSELDEVFAKYKNRCIDVGIAEEHAMTMAAGVAVSGFHPLVSIYSTFMQRAYDEISHDLCRTKQNATIVVDRVGMSGNDGSSHQGIFDEALLINIPNTVVAMASNPGQIPSLIEESFNNHGVFAIRSPRGCANAPINEAIRFGCWKEEIVGKDKGTAIVSVGPLTEDLKVALISSKKNVTLINAIYQKPLNMGKVKQLLDYKKIIIYDAYSTEDGFARLLTSELVKNSFKGEIVVKAIPNVFIKHGKIPLQIKEFNLTVDDVIKEI